MHLRQLGCSTGTGGLRPGFRGVLHPGWPGSDGAEVMAGRRRAVGALAALVTLVTAGCSTSGLASLPLPHPGVGKGGYNLNVVFENALNLPAFARCGCRAPT